MHPPKFPPRATHSGLQGINDAKNNDDEDNEDSNENGGGVEDKKHKSLKALKHMLLKGR